jgi:hypothetical protein
MGSKIYCEFCHVQIVGNDPVAIRNGLTYHQHHTPEKTGKPKLAPSQLANLPDKTKAVM